MAWTAPRTWVAAEVVTAALLNTHLRDNLLETAAATATTAGDIVYADAANSMGTRLGIGTAASLLVSDGSDPVWRLPVGDFRSDTATGTPAGYLSLGGASWYNDSNQVEATVTTGTQALVLFSANLANDTAGAKTLVSYDVSSATTSAATDARSISYESSGVDDLAQFGTYYWHTGLTAGSNKFRMYGRVTGGTGSIGNPRIFALPL